MSDRTVTEQRADEAFKALVRSFDDRLTALESRRTQGDIQLKSLQVNEGLSVGGESIDAMIAAAVDASGFATQQKMTLPGPLTLTTSFQDVPGTTVTITGAGLYLVLGSFEMAVTALSAGNLIYGTITAAGHVSASVAIAFHVMDVVALYETRVAVGLVRFGAAGGTTKLEARRTGATGTSQIIAANTNTAITVVRVAA